MKRLAIPSIFAATLLSACAGNSLAPQSSNRFSVNSQPEGASVYVMGERLGETPLELSSSQVFPVTYPSALQDKYGKVELKYPGCQPYEKAISGYVLANGMNARLDCGQAAPEQTPAAAAAAPAQATANPDTIQERLRALKSIFEEGLITEDEYRAKRQLILQEL